MKQYIPNFDISKKVFTELNNKVDIPTYQRSYVWTKNQQNDLITTIKKGLPFGSLLLAKKKNKYNILDGQQRFTTIRKYFHNPYFYCEIDEKIILKLIKKRQLFEKV